MKDDLTLSRAEDDPTFLQPDIANVGNNPTC
jgi:hypothetical protein